MNWVKLLSGASVVLVVLWIAGSTVELFATTFSIGPHVTASLAVVAFLAVALAVTILAGARNRRWLENPDSYW